MIRNLFPTYFSSFLTAFYFCWAGGGENFSGKRVRRQENIFSAHPLMTDDLPFGGVGSLGDDR